MLSVGIVYEEKVQGRWGRVATRCAAIAGRDEDSHREEDIIMHKDYDLPPAQYNFAVFEHAYLQFWSTTRTTKSPVAPGFDRVC